jgi:peptidyl-dipeptidase A
MRVLSRATAVTTLIVLATSSVVAAPPTVEDAAAFVERAEARFLTAVVEAERAAWVQQNFITDDTELIASQAEQKLIATIVELAGEATRFDALDLPYDVARKLKLLKLWLSKPAPDDAAKQAELTRVTTGMGSRYGKGKYCPEGGECLSLNDMINAMAASRDSDALRDMWVGWRKISVPMRDEYRRFVELANEGAHGLGFADLGAMWRSKYDMDPDAFAAEIDRLWGQVRPFYEALHCHVRAKLAETYGSDVVPADRPIPAHLLGNMWAQQWGNIYELVAPETGDPGYDLTSLLQEKDLDARDMVEYGERFFTSLGFKPLPDTFWDRSLFTKPADREVVCHASAWDVDYVDDLRIKMCIDVNEEDFVTIHHELGHNFYQRAYAEQGALYRESANDGFHEGIGDTLALSITPEYLVQIGMLEKAPGAEGDVGLLLRQALDKIAFLPFGLLVDQWRWKVFSGEIPPEKYNEGWWTLRTRYQGIEPPVSRSEADFDPGAKYHVPFNTPYTRYFLAHILQFQFHRGLCEQAGFEGPLHRCSIYGSQEAGASLKAMLEMGMSRPWPEALEAVTGETKMDARAILDYFAPLKAWLDEQNRGRTCGW